MITAQIDEGKTVLIIEGNGLSTMAELIVLTSEAITQIAKKVEKPVKEITKLVLDGVIYGTQVFNEEDDENE